MSFNKSFQNPSFLNISQPKPTAAVTLANSSTVHEPVDEIVEELDETDGETSIAQNEVNESDEEISEKAQGIDLYENEDQTCSESTTAQIQDLPEQEETHSIAQTTRSSFSENIGRKPEKVSAEGGAFDFQKFLKFLKNKKCHPLIGYLKSFLTKFSERQWNHQEHVVLTKDFETFIYNKTAELDFPAELLNDESFKNNIREGFEKLITTKLYHIIFPICKDKDVIFHENLYHYQFLQPKHLDIAANFDIKSSFFQLACNEIIKINKYKSPRDKIICILNCCKVIFALIRQDLKLEENADNFVPILVLILLLAKPKNLPSNLTYIESFRNELFLVGETSYYLNTLQLGCNFIMSMNKQLLTIDTEAEFDQEYAANQKNLQQERKKKEIAHETDDPLQHLKESAGTIQQSISSWFTNKPDDEEIIKNVQRLSLEEQSHAQEMHDKIDQVCESMSQMFPNLDKELVRDVVAMKNAQIGECVDACLLLAE